MQFEMLDYCALIGYLLVVVVLALWMSRRQQSSEDYFLAGRKLTWGLIGISLIAWSFSIQHFVGACGATRALGLAYAAVEWTAAVALVLVAIFLLPKFLRRRVYTIPEYVETRFGAGTRGLMAFYLLGAYVFVIIAAVLYAGAKWTETTFQLPLAAGVWAIGLTAGVYTVWGGLKAVVWANLFNGLALLLGGAVVTVLGFLALGDGQGFFHGVAAFCQHGGHRLEMVKPMGHPDLPWVAVFVGGLWVLQLFHWGSNQFVAQRALGAKSVAQGQKGLLLAASLKLVIPLIIVVPAIIAFQLSAGDRLDPDQAYPRVACRMLPIGFRGLLLATLCGAFLSSLDAMLHAASTIFTIDFYQRHFHGEASQRRLVGVGRWATVGFIILACLWAPQLGWIAGDRGVFYYIVKTWGLIAPGIVAVFLFGLLSKRTPSRAAVGAMLLGPPVSMGCLKTMPDVASLHQMAFAFVFLSVYMALVTLLTPLRDVEASEAGEDATGPQPPAGLLANTLIPFLTAILGAYLVGLSLFHFSWITIYQFLDRWGMVTFPDWIHFANAGVPTAVYFAVALWLMRRPAPAARLVQPAKDDRPARSFFRLLVTREAAALAAVVMGVQVYLFSLWVIPDYPPEDYWQGYYVDLSVMGTKQPVISEKPLVEEQAEPVPVSEAEPPDAEATAAPMPPPTLQQGPSEQEPLTIYLTPLWIALGSVLAFAIMWEWLRAISARPGVDSEPTTRLDPRPSRLAPVWGLMIVVVAVVLFCLLL